MVKASRPHDDAVKGITEEWIPVRLSEKSEPIAVKRITIDATATGDDVIAAFKRIVRPADEIERKIYQGALDLQAPHVERGKKHSADQSVKGRKGAEARWSGEDQEDLDSALHRLARRRDALGDWEEPSELWPDLVGTLPAASERNGSNLKNASVIYGNDRNEFTYSAFRKRIARIRKQ
jgi:hypothetical protein